MEISLFEIVAQIINFFVLLFILNWLFYKPVTKAMANRKERIQKAEKAAAKKMDQAEMLIDNYENKIQSVENEKRHILETYRNEALAEKESLLEKYEKEAKSKRKVYLNEIEEEKEYFIKKLRQELGRNAVEIASKILTTISSKELEAEVFKSFINDLEMLKENLPNQDILDQQTHLNLSSYKALSTNEKAAIEKALEKSISNIDNIVYETKKDLIIGYELNLETYTIHNSIKTYLDEIEDNITNFLESQQL